MNAKIWLIIKDDTKRTFEVCGQDTNDNAFFNQTYAMQKAGMNVSCITLPVSVKFASRDLIKITGYSTEEGLHKRLLNQFTSINIGAVEDW